MDAITKLISIGSESLGPSIRIEDQPERWKQLGHGLLAVLMVKNGFLAFESALLVRPLSSGKPPRGILEWNDPSLWLDQYRLRLPEMTFFAEDIFGHQFAIRGGEIIVFDAETAEIEVVATNMNEWAEKILSDFEYLTGYPLASDWQRKNGPLALGHRLVPKQLFVLGGSFSSENLRVVDEVKGMRARGFFASELARVPDGSRVTFELTD